MRNKTISMILAVFLLVSSSGKAGSNQLDPALKIYLPREITIEGDVPNLGQVAVIRGDENLKARAEQITLGRIAAPGQKIIVDRLVVLSRLSSGGIPASEVTFTGAEKIMIFRQHQIIQGGEFVEKALAFVKKNLQGASICQYNPVRTPRDLIVADISENIKLSCNFTKSNIKNRAKVFISAFSGDKEIGSREVSFSLKYNCRQLVAQIDIPSGEIITPENTRIEKAISNRPEPTNWQAPYGLAARRRLPVNTVIKNNMVGPVKPKVLLKRNQNVIIRIDTFGLLVTAVGKTMQKGHVGEYIKVRNVDSQRIIMAKVNEDGTVEPIF